MATKRASEIKAGDVILLEDGRKVTVAEAISNLRSHIQIAWLEHGERRFANYHRNDAIYTGHG
jgi:hypothetical protein